ncbi:MAG: hypothetical protein A3J58_03240 [Candidatus Sungbacteria bacterium RIFCSPHIGHO2_02_FULL_52_23]|uniref:Transcriptional repressor PaaX-like central Cas2-like domain-containing protein n=1 Tax=Candidatus Sungbacteria bacterium RIFCSPHIGHO2_02_FULL_52_23 TaxID=1802274 RepID=A0A1G2KVS3_9BACT|nr:MAG: hypothetical protein A3J58_03240 [Candidatus Sungbacteria bacterium RIFCSPHIGHO2_02_FULL_52_23]
MKNQEEKKYSIGRATLEILGGLGEATLGAFFPRKYSYANMWRPLLGLERSRKITRHTVSTILWRLQREGLIVRMGGRKNAKWRLSPAGRARVDQVEANIENNVSDGITRLVIFDIPERERQKRTAVRAELITCGFRHFQKSVWIGDCPLPVSFITLLDDLALAGKVHIFSVREQGTIGRVS